MLTHFHNSFFCTSHVLGPPEIPCCRGHLSTVHNHDLMCLDILGSEIPIPNACAGRRESRSQASFCNSKYRCCCSAVCVETQGLAALQRLIQKRIDLGVCFLMVVLDWDMSLCINLQLAESLPGWGFDNKTPMHELSSSSATGYAPRRVSGSEGILLEDRRANIEDRRLARAIWYELLARCSRIEIQEHIGIAEGLHHDAASV